MQLHRNPARKLGNLQRESGGLLRRMARWVLYPFVILVTFALDHLFQVLGAGSWFSAYGAVAIGSLGLIFWLERHFPHKREWRDSATESRTDLQFLVLVGTLLPMTLALGLVALSSTLIPSLLPSKISLWPRSLNTWQQVLLILLIADCTHYWLHRCCHDWPILWRLHSIHHAVQKVNMLNSTRFHPLETSLQFLCDTAPFILLGVSPDVMALYYVLQVSKGLLQHSNLDVRLGLANRIISGPELHRLHHSIDPIQSNTNFGSKLSIWDSIWGTYMRPANQVITAIGIEEDDGQAPFMEQLRRPFRAKTKSA